MAEKPVNKAKNKHISIDDFASKKEVSYDTVMVDADTHHVLDVIEDRNKADVIEYLEEYPHTEIMLRVTC